MHSQQLQQMFNCILHPLSTAAAIIRVEDEVTGEVDDIIVKKEITTEHQGQQEEGVEEVTVGDVEPIVGKSANPVEELAQVEEMAQEIQLPEALPNGDLTPEMILSMMDRWWVEDLDLQLSALNTNNRPHFLSTRVDPYAQLLMFSTFKHTRRLHTVHKYTPLLQLKIDSFWCKWWSLELV